MSHDRGTPESVPARLAGRSIIATRYSDAVMSMASTRTRVLHSFDDKTPRYDLSWAVFICETKPNHLKVRDVRDYIECSVSSWVESHWFFTGWNCKCIMEHLNSTLDCLLVASAIEAVEIRVQYDGRRTNTKITVLNDAERYRKATRGMA